MFDHFFWIYIFLSESQHVAVNLLLFFFFFLIAVVILPLKSDINSLETFLKSSSRFKVLKVPVWLLTHYGMMKLSACLCHISPYCLYLCVSACHLQAQSFLCKSNYILIEKLSNDWTSEDSSMLEAFFFFIIILSPP